jgi:hypothetical protein
MPKTKTKDKPTVSAPPRSKHTRPDVKEKGATDSTSKSTDSNDDVRFRDIIHPDDSRTCILYPEALAGVVGIRATNIDSGSEIFVPIKGGEDSKVIALMEVIARRCPIKVQIPISSINGRHRYEEWSVNDMLIPPNTKKLLETCARYLPSG